MNFSPFGSHFPTSLPIHQFAAKFSPEPNTSSASTNSNNLNGLGNLGNEEPVRYTNISNFNPMTSGLKYQRDNITQTSNNVLTSSSTTIHHYGSNILPTYNNAQHSLHQRHHQDASKGSAYHSHNLIKREGKELEGNDYSNVLQHQQQHQSSSGINMPPAWQSIATPGSTVADYLSHLPASTLPISLHHFLKYSAENIKKDLSADDSSNITTIHHPQHDMASQHQTPPPPNPPPSAGNLIQPAATCKKKKKKKASKEKKPRPKPGEIRITTALDGSTLYCCPECQMAYPDKSLLEQHLLGHTMERRFFCDICGAGLKRKDHLTRHKQSHNPDRPFVCSVCMKAFKRKEQLTLHFVIHSGEKRHVCQECGKGFYRKDHLRKHTRSHIARRVKAELSQHVPTSSQGTMTS
ncbi:hypothetical protein M8J76_012730 [Diaphorina citri]|nr:hypothetical protein M8J75_012342 [Diaphorina citri]KAI5723920.1 hypothetical protein M8J76_012730 [Diaphorina citri]KAI5727686.1 hypothetical protein M8J77_005641 [Diaphorina citri]